MSKQDEKLMDSVMGWPYIAHADALYVQAQGLISTEEKNGYLAGIGCNWPLIRPLLVRLLMGETTDVPR